jgi:hypothetical protein
MPFSPTQICNHRHKLTFFKQQLVKKKKKVIYLITILFSSSFFGDEIGKCHFHNKASA